MAKLLNGSTVNGHLIWHDGSTDQRESALVYASTTQLIPTGAWTPINFDTVLFDKLSGWNMTNGNYVVQKGGIYFIVGAINWANTTTGVRSLLELRVNGLEYAWLTQEHSGANKDFSVTGTIVVELNVGDVITLHAYHDVGTNMDTVIIANGTGGISPSTFFNISKFA